MYRNIVRRLTKSAKGLSQASSSHAPNDIFDDAEAERLAVDDDQGNVEGNSGADDQSGEEKVQLQCTSWRVAVEANNLSPWKKIPEECGDYVRDYMTQKGYEIDLQRVCNEAGIYAKSVNMSGDGKIAWIFDVDETLLSNLPYYADHGYGGFKLGFQGYHVDWRSERHRSITVDNLLQAGYRNWDKLILRSSEDHGKTATMYKSEKRSELVEEGYHILGNSGDQWSDILGSSMSKRSFKLPNPMYYIP
ncbi:hypothetical protein DH2020_044347 [Rehmannia glutinosa]|uniref:Acid phosphatase n=1 Tax=Rehmannia glutinosa TaxID=99300 RepID=A0ABR0UHF2_REHGL